MPVYNDRDIIPFVNQLEVRIDGLQEDMNTWTENRSKILSSVSRVDANTQRSTVALARSEEALSEINTATYDVTASRGHRLKAVLDKLKNDILKVIEESGGSGSGSGGGISKSFGDERINQEVNNAISSVNSLVDDGIKLDYRLKEIEKIATSGGDLNYKKMIVPYLYRLEKQTSKVIQLEEEDNIKYIAGEVTVLDQNRNPIIRNSSDLIEGVINEDGLVTLNYAPPQNSVLYFPVKMNFTDVPEEFVLDLIDMVVQKNSEYMKSILFFEREQKEILADIQAMQGANWTADYSIMGNYREQVKESITPKGLHLNVVDGEAKLTFSYNDHPNLSHFEIEKLNKETNEFEPFKTIQK